MECDRDPDYEITQVVKEQMRIREDAEKNQCVERVKSIIKREFQRELDLREKQLELVQHRITKVEKTLHLLRYCLVMSYYSRSELQFNSNENDTALFDGQSRLHPAVKKLLGNNTSEIHTSLGLRKKRNVQKAVGNIVTQESNDCTLKKDSFEENEAICTDSLMDNILVERKMDNTHTVRNRKLYKHQIVVGNISKWAPSESPDDNSTHKWMMYVRGPKEFPDISHIVEKAVFFLHPSYKPNDVIEISQSPFHLSRRGWGEFPLRIQLFFHGKLNKPVDIIHNLKLDKTYTGRQTLGNETVIELSLYELTKSNIEDTIFTTNIKKSTTKLLEEMDINITKFENTTDSIQAEPMDIKVEIEPTIVTQINLDHCYCLTDLETTKDIEIKLELSNENENLETSNIQKIDTDDRVQIGKRKKLQKSVLKSSVLKKFKVNATDMSSNGD